MLVFDPAIDWESTFADDPEFEWRPDPEHAEAAALDLARAAKEYEAQAAATETFVDDLKRKIARRRDTATRLRSMALATMKCAGLTKVKDDVLTASITKGRERLAVIDEKAIPDQWWRVKRELAKSDIMKHIKDTGEIPDGCDLEVGEDSLTIRM